MDSNLNLTLANSIADLLIKEQLICIDSRTTMINGLSNGTLKETEWKNILEFQLTKAKKTEE